MDENDRIDVPTQARHTFLPDQVRVGLCRVCDRLEEHETHLPQVTQAQIDDMVRVWAKIPEFVKDALMVTTKVTIAGPPPRVIFDGLGVVTAPVLFKETERTTFNVPVQGGGSAGHRHNPQGAGVAFDGQGNLRALPYQHPFESSVSKYTVCGTCGGPVSDPMHAVPTVADYGLKTQMADRQRIEAESRQKRETERKAHSQAADEVHTAFQRKAARLEGSKARVLALESARTQIDNYRAKPDERLDKLQEAIWWLRREQGRAIRAKRRAEHEAASKVKVAEFGTESGEWRVVGEMSDGTPVQVAPVGTPNPLQEFGTPIYGAPIGGSLQESAKLDTPKAAEDEKKRGTFYDGQTTGGWPE